MALERIEKAARSNQPLRTNLSTAKLDRAKLDGATADKNTIFPKDFDAKKAGVIIK